MDGGSTDETLDIARRFDVERILENELKTGEAGKAVELKEAEGDLLLSLDRAAAPERPAADAAEHVSHEEELQRALRPALAPARQSRAPPAPDDDNRTSCSRPVLRAEPSRGPRDSHGRASCGTCAAYAVPAGWSTTLPSPH